MLRLKDLMNRILKRFRTFACFIFEVLDVSPSWDVLTGRRRGRLALTNYKLVS